MKAIDLSQRIYDGLRPHPSHPKIVIRDVMKHELTAHRFLPPCKGFATKELTISDHACTHVDAPMHCYPQGEGIDKQDLSNYFGEAILLDVSSKKLRQPVDLELVQRTLNREGLQINSGDIVLIRAWAEELGMEQFHEANGLTVDAARWLRERGMKAVGTDLGNIEDNSDLTRQVHMFLLGEKVPIYENLTNLELIPVKRFLFVGFPLNLQDCTGSPVRAVALLD